MAITYYPKMGQILVCNFSGFKPPEMVKVRPVIIISPKLPGRAEILTVVPISLTPPIREQPFAVRLSRNYHPKEPDDRPCWAKCDMVMNISRQRLDGFKVDRRKYVTPNAEKCDLDAVRAGVLHGLGFGDLLK